MKLKPKDVMRVPAVQVIMIVLVVFISSSIFAQNSNPVGDSLEIGVPHPELGGVVFYLNGEGGGLIVDSEDLLNPKFDNLSMFPWAEHDQLLTSVNIDYTQFNDWEATSNRSDDSIIEAYGDTGSYAAKAIRDQKGPEWRLPTATESYFIYFNLKQNGYVNLDDGHYWSSTEVAYDAAEITPPNVVATDMQTGEQSTYMAKVQALKIRAVRSF